MSFESELKAKTSSEADINKDQESSLLEQLTQLANAEIESFKKACKEAANTGKRTCSRLTFAWINYGVTPNDFYGSEYIFVGVENGGDLNINGIILPQQANVFQGLLKDALVNSDFQNASISKHPINMNRVSYKRQRGIFSVKSKATSQSEFVAERFCISTSW